MDNFKIFDMIQENDDPHMSKCALLRPIRKNIKDLHRRLIFLEDKSLIEHIDTDGEFIVSAGRKYEIDVWDMFEGTHVRKLIGHEGPIVGLKLQMIGMQETGPIDRIIIGASADGAIIQWSVQTGVMLRKFVTNSTLTCMTVLNKLFAVTGNNKGQLELYHLSSGTKQISVQAHDDPIDALLVNKDYICTTVSDRRNLKIWIYNETIKCIYELEEYKTKFNAFAIYDNILILGDALSQKLHFLFFKRREKFIVELQQSGGEVQQINVANNYITCTTIDETGMIYLHNQSLQKLNSIISFPCYYMQMVSSVSLLINESMLKFVIGGSALIIFELDFSSFGNDSNHDQELQYSKFSKTNFPNTTKDDIIFKEANVKYPEEQIFERKEFSPKDLAKIKKEFPPDIQLTMDINQHTNKYRETFINASNLNETLHLTEQHVNNDTREENDDILLNEIGNLSIQKEIEEIDLHNDAYIKEKMKVEKDTEITVSGGISQNENNDICMHEEDSKQKSQVLNQSLENTNIKPIQKTVTFETETDKNKKKKNKRKGSKKIKKCLLM